MGSLHEAEFFISFFTVDPPRITQHPKDQLVFIGTDIILNVGAIGDDLQFQWQKDRSDLFDGGRYFATNTDTLRIIQVKNDDTGHYRCLVTNDVGRKSSEEAFLTISKLVVDHNSRRIYFLLCTHNLM